MKTAVYVGDMHATPSELEECHEVVRLAAETAKEAGADTIVFLGDQYNNHDTMSVRVMNFWTLWFRRLLSGCDVVAVVGNHDQAGTGLGQLHSMRAHPNITVVEGPTVLGDGVVGVPYYHENEDLYQAVAALRSAHPEAHTLVCHATFDGSRYENGMYAPGGADLAKIPFQTVISGHIHTPQDVGVARYIGAPRWRTRSDANVDRYIHVVEHEGGTRFVRAIPTDSAARRIWTLDDTPAAPATLEGMDANRNDVRVDVYGPADHVKAREAWLRAQGAKTRGFPDRQDRLEVRESQGIPQAFAKFMGSFKSPYATPPSALATVLEERLAAVPS